MFNEENTNNTCGDNDSIRRAITKIKHDSQFKAITCEGPPGPPGPPGPASTIDSILTGYDGIQAVASNANLDLGTLINSTGDSLSFSAPNTVTVNEEGTYFINFSSIIYNTNSAGDLGVSLRINGTTVPTASEYITTQTSAFSSELQHNYDAQVGDTITLVNQSTVSNSYHDVTLSIIKLV